jgi:hypothetical protein
MTTGIYQSFLRIKKKFLQILLYNQICSPRQPLFLSSLCLLIVGM